MFGASEAACALIGIGKAGTLNYPSLLQGMTLSVALQKDDPNICNTYLIKSFPATDFFLVPMQWKETT